MGRRRQRRGSKAASGRFPQRVGEPSQSAADIQPLPLPPAHSSARGFIVLWGPVNYISPLGRDNSQEAAGLLSVWVPPTVGSKLYFFQHPKASLGGLSGSCTHWATPPALSSQFLDSDG